MSDTNNSKPNFFRRLFVFGTTPKVLLNLLGMALATVLLVWMTFFSLKCYTRHGKTYEVPDYIKHINQIRRNGATHGGGRRCRNILNISSYGKLFEASRCIFLTVPIQMILVFDFDPQVPTHILSTSIGQVLPDARRHAVALVARCEAVGDANRNATCIY